MMDAAALEALLRASGCSITEPRRAILRVLAGNTSHPTATAVYAAVTDECPKASRATVYNTLGLLTELGALRTLREGESETRFDPNVSPHHHRHCPVCGALEDVHADQVEVRLNGARISTSVRFDAPCAGCG